MPFHSILTELLEADEDARAALFVDDSGELIGIACPDGERDRLELVAAYLPLYLQRLRSALGDSEAGRPRLIHIQRASMHLHAAALPDDYVLSLITGPRGAVSTRRRRLERAASRLALEVIGG